MLKIIKNFRFDYWRSICLCQKMSPSIMKIFVSVITFFKTPIHILGVKTCKLDIICVKMPLKPLLMNNRGIEELMWGRLGDGRP